MDLWDLLPSAPPGLGGVKGSREDGIPLRFKGMVLYRISAPEIAASRFDFQIIADMRISYA